MDGEREHGQQRGSIVRDALALAGVGGALLLLFALFLLPWLPRTPSVGTLERYLPLRSGSSTFWVDGGDAPRGWQSGTVELIEPFNLWDVIDPQSSATILEWAGVSEEAEDVQAMIGQVAARLRLVRTRTRYLSPDGGVVAREALAMRHRDGDLLLSFTEAGQTFHFEPPALLLPAALEDGASWQSEGSWGTAPYRYRGRARALPTLDTPWHHFEDCIEVATEFELHAGASVQTLRGRDWYCAGEGLVRSEAAAPTQPDGPPVTELYRLSRDGPLPADAPQPPRLAAAGPPLPGVPLSDPAGWSLRRVGSARPENGSTFEITAPLRWLPAVGTEPPLLLAASYSGELIALAIRGAGVEEEWRFRAGGTIFSPIAYDPPTGLLFFGASDKRLYALDRRGLFLWSARTGDNVAAQPLVVGEALLGGSEDFRLYGWQAATGQPLWSPLATGGPIVASPVEVAGRALWASYDGTVTMLEAATGTVLGQYTAEEGIEAALLAHEGLLYAISRDGTLVALDPARCLGACEPLWTSRAPESSLLFPHAPAACDEHLFLVDDRGSLHVWERHSGRWLRASSETPYHGTPLRVDGLPPPPERSGSQRGQPPAGRARLLVTGGDVLFLVDEWGRVLHSWANPGDRFSGEGSAWFRQPPVRGGDGFWLADSKGTIFRLGAP